MITRIPTTTILASATPTCSNKSKSRAMQKHTNKIINTAAVTEITAGESKKKANATCKIITTMGSFSLAVLQVLLLAYALPPPLQPLLPAILSPQRLLAVEALPITSKPIESTAENLAWQAWLMLPPEQKQLEKSRKVTPKSIFSLPFRECPPGHQLFQSRCIPTVNINQSDLLTQQVLGLFVGSTNDGGTGATGSSDNAYEFDYGEEEYGLGLGDGESVVMYESPQPYNGGAGSTAADTLNTQQQHQQQQQPQHVRDEPLKFNLFAQKYPTSDYETDISSGSDAVEGSGSARPLTDLMPANMSEGGGERIDATANGADAVKTQFLDEVQGFMQSHVTVNGYNNNKTMTMPNVNTTTATTKTDHNNRTADEKQPANQSHQGLGDLHAASSNISAFAVDEIDAIILPAVGTGSLTATALGGEGVVADGGAGSAGVAGGDLEPQRISLFKDDASVQLHVTTTVIAQTGNGNRTGVEDAIRVADDAEDLVVAATAQQQQNSIAQFLRADALLPLSSVAPYIMGPTATATTTPASTAPLEKNIAETTKIPPPLTKDEHPRSVAQQKSSETAKSNTDAQEMGFVTTTEADSTTNFQIDETTVLEANDEFAKTAEQISLLEAISQQQQLESEKSKVELPEDGTTETTTAHAVVINEETATATTTTANRNIINDTNTITDKTNEETTTIVPASFEVNFQSVDETTQTETTTTQPLPSSVDTQSTTKIATTTAKVILTTTTNVDRFHSVPAAVVTAVAPNHLTANKQVSAAVSPGNIAQTADTTDSGKTAAAAVAGVADVSQAAVNDMPGSGINDLVNVAASTIKNNGDNNNNKNKNNKKPTIRSVLKKAVATTTSSEINIEQELRMINELVKGNRQLAAMKMAALKTITEIPPAAAVAVAASAITTTTLPTASKSKLEMKKSANAAKNEKNVSDGDVVAVEVEAWRDIVGPTTTIVYETTTPTTAQTTTITAEDTIVRKSSMSVFTDGKTHETKGSTHTKITTETQSQTSAKMESGSSVLAEAETTTVKNSKVAETAQKIIELATITSAEPQFEFESEVTATSTTEAGGATLWSRIMPIFGFGGGGVAVEPDVQEAAAAATTTKTTTHKIAESASSVVSSISSNNSNNSSISSNSSKSSISDIRSISANDNNNNIINNENNKNVDSLIRRNSKIIRIDHLSDNNVAAATATTTNTLEEAPATGTTITVAENTAATATTTTTKHDENTHENKADEPSAYWWLPAGWRLDSGINEEPPLLYRLWSAFPESQIKAKVRT